MRERLRLHVSDVRLKLRIPLGQALYVFRATLDADDRAAHLFQAHGEVANSGADIKNAFARQAEAERFEMRHARVVQREGFRRIEHLESAALADAFLLIDSAPDLHRVGKSFGQRRRRLGFLLSAELAEKTLHAAHLRIPRNSVFGRCGARRGREGTSS